ncbi:MAG: alpha/beta fold hydrolase [Propionibacteriaceae bacterium]|jgi:pimeloyl-ACP methyl ester carboxylesterase
MSIDHTVVLLPGLGDASAQTTAQRAALEQLAPVLTPDIAVSDTGPVILEDPALRVLATIIAADTDDAVLIGHGWGSMVALQIAATHSEQIAALMLSTNARLETIMIRSIFYGVLGLLPATVVQQLGGRPADVAALFDQVRPVDFKRLAEQIRAPALVVVGERDVANRGPSAALAKSLPLGNLRVVPQAGAGWQAQQPQLLAELLVDFLSGST